MKKTFYALALAALISAPAAWCGDENPLYSASHRLDAYKKDGTFISFLIDDIQKITYGQPDGGGFFNTFDILKKSNETVKIPMSEYPVIKYAGLSREYLQIDRIWDENSEIIMLDCINNDHYMRPDKPLDWVAEKPDGCPHFLYPTTPGWDAVCSITGQYTGKVYTDDEPDFIFWSKAEDNHLMQDSWAFFMPNEPVAIETVSTERTTYLGKDFVGTYKGYMLQPAAGNLWQGSNPEMTAELKYNESYNVTSTDANGYSFIDMYDYFEDSGTFSYQESEETHPDYISEPRYKASGKFLPDGFAYIKIINSTENKPENTRFYLAAKESFTLTYAAWDTYGSEYLLEAKTPAASKWFVAEDYGYRLKEAEIEFMSGNGTIAEPCEAIVSYDGESQFKYILEAGGKPRFVRKGVEAGSYDAADGTSPVLELDGFGNASLGGTSVKYTADGSVITVVVDDETRLFLLDMNGRTYSEIVSDEWDGADVYSNSALPGAFYGYESTRNTMKIAIDQDLRGNAAPGEAAISVMIHRNDGFSDITAVSDVRKYVYDAEAGTLTITNVYLGTPDGGNGRQNITFKLSDDKNILYLEGDAPYVYAASYPGCYVDAGIENALEAETPIVPVELAERYTGGLKFDYMGMPGDATATLTIGKDLDGNAKEGFASIDVTAMGAHMISCCAAYELKGKTLTLKGVTVGDGNYGTQIADIAFEIGDDGALQGAGKFFGCDMNTAFMAVDFASGKLMPEVSETVTLAGQYAGGLKFDYMGMPGDATATLTIGKDLDGNAKEGFASIDVTAMGAHMISCCAAYELKGKTLTLKGVTVGDGNYGTQTADIAFEIGDDGALQGAGKFFGCDMNTAFMAVDFASGKLVPEV